MRILLRAEARYGAAWSHIPRNPSKGRILALDAPVASAFPAVYQRPAPPGCLELLPRGPSPHVPTTMGPVAVGRVSYPPVRRDCFPTLGTLRGANPRYGRRATPSHQANQLGATWRDKALSRVGRASLHDSTPGFLARCRASTGWEARRTDDVGTSSHFRAWVVLPCTTVHRASLPGVQRRRAGKAVVPTTRERRPTKKIAPEQGFRGDFAEGGLPDFSGVRRRAGVREGADGHPGA